MANQIQSALKSEIKLASKHLQGYSLIELMVAAALGLMLMALVVAAVTSATAISGRISQAGEVFENAQYLTRLLKDELSLAGFYGHFDGPVNYSDKKPDICKKISNRDIVNMLPYPIDGINDVASGDQLCGMDQLLAGSDVLLVRRSLLPEYLSISELKSKQHWSVKDWHQTIFYLSADNNFKRRRFLKGKYTPAEPLVEGVIDFQLQYGIRSSSLDSGEQVFKTEFVEFPSSNNQWQQLVAIRFYLLLSSTDESSGDGSRRLLNYLGKQKQVSDNRQYDLFSGIARLKNISPVMVEFDVEN